MSHQPIAPMPDDYHSGYHYSHELPVLSEMDWRRGLRWRWNTSDIQATPGDGVMACYLTKVPFWQWMTRLFFASYREWLEANPPLRTHHVEPLAEQEYRHPPGLDLDAFWFRLDLRGNPRDVGFEWAWMRPLLPVPENPQPRRRSIGMTIGSGKTSHLPFPAGNDHGPCTIPPRDVEFEDYMESEYITLDEYRAVQRGDLPNMNKRLHTFDDRYQRPVCRCGRSHPELSTPMRVTRSGKQDWHYKGSYYRCNGCGRKWQSANLKAAMELKPLVKPVRLRKETVPESDEYDTPLAFP